LLLWRHALSRDTVTAVLIQLKNDPIFDDEVSNAVPIRMFDEGDPPRPVIGKVFALASERPIVEPVSELLQGE
jgi:hypothetical protein